MRVEPLVEIREDIKPRAAGEPNGPHFRRAPGAKWHTLRAIEVWLINTTGDGFLTIVNARAVCLDFANVEHVQMVQYCPDEDVCSECSNLVNRGRY